LSKRTKVGALAMSAIVALSLLVVVMAADRPSWLASTTHSNYFPRWMAGPLGGLFPSLIGNDTTLKYWVTGSIVLMYISYLVLLRCTPQLPVRWVLVAILAVHAIFVLSPPLTLTDVFNYINYGRMEVVHHLNPYTTIPILEPHNDPAYALSNWHELRSPYGPLFTMLTFLVVPLGVAGSFWAWKLALAAASLGTIVLVWKCARLLGRDPLSAVVLVGLNPIVLMWGLGGDHNDAVMVLFIMLGFYLLLRARAVREQRSEPRPAGLRGWLAPLAPFEIGAGAAFVLATAIKASGGVLIPVVLVSLLRAPRALIQVLLGMIAAAVVVGTIGLLAFGLHIPDLSTQSHVVSNESVPNLIGLAIGLGGETNGLRTVMTGVLAVVMLLCCRLAWRRRDAIAASGWASVALVFALSWVLPWYVLWSLPLAALSGSRRLRAAVLVAGAYLIVAWAPASSLLWSAIGFHPESTPVGRLHQRYIKELLN
jgi:alpha-1,6-mannosyltransferase